MEQLPRRALAEVVGSTSRGRNTADGLSRLALREARQYAIAVLQLLKMEPPFSAGCALHSRIDGLSITALYSIHYTS